MLDSTFIVLKNKIESLYGGDKIAFKEDSLVNLINNKEMDNIYQLFISYKSKTNFFAISSLFYYMFDCEIETRYFNSVLRHYNSVLQTNNEQVLDDFINEILPNSEYILDQKKEVFAEIQRVLLEKGYLVGGEVSWEEFFEE